jgi:FkbM family methyltransferase
MELTLNDRRLSRHLLAPKAIVSGTALSLMTDLEIVALDIGARGGFDFLLAPIAPMVTFVGFDPDSAEIARLEKSGATGWGGVRYLPEAIGSQQADRKLYLTKSPGCTSLLESNPDMYERYGRSELFEIISENTVSPVGLDFALQKYSISNPAYLKIDIQGAELEALQTGERSLTESIVAIRTEVEFQPVYKSQPLFRDVDAYLDSRGFVLSGFHHPIAWCLGTKGQPHFEAGANCQGDLIHADAFYFRKLDNYRDTSEEEVRLCVRGALVALALGRLSYASQLLHRRNVSSWLRDTYGVDLTKVIPKAKELMRKHLRSQKLTNLLRTLVRG